MCDALVWSLDAVRWPETISAFAAVVTAIIAMIALQTWKYQDQAKSKAEFLDALIETAHTYIAEIPKPITLLEMAKIGMTSHAPTWENGEQGETAIRGAIAYIQKHGEQNGKQLLEVLEPVQSLVIKLRSLTAKGQVFKFDNYVECQNAVVMLTCHFDKIEAFTAVICSPTWNWDHPEVLKLLRNVMTINPEEIRADVKKNNVAILEFARESYKRLYG